jgi:nicotinamidase-related amidase
MTKILVVVDVQNDFVDGSLRNEEAIKKIPNIVKKIEEFNGNYIFVTRDTHFPNYLESNEGKHLPVVHCVNGTDGWFINADVAKALHAKELSEDTCIISYINKPTFGSTDLVEKIKSIMINLKENEIELEFIGFCTDICVVSNVLLCKANFYETANIIVDSSCCAGVTPESHEAALTTMRMCQIDII